ncbi:MAG: GntR family transcriptional regulator, sialic acid-inducible nan operon repressor [Hyphomicrobiales bacterium]|jgi:DNA-binding FadR family transcriptional regulator
MKGGSNLAVEIEARLRHAPIERARLYEQISSHIEGLIVSGRLQPGDTLPSERELTQLFSVGRTAIREALFELQRKGVVATQNGARPVVARPTPDVIFATLSGSVGLYLSTEGGMHDFQYARRILEGGVVRQAAQKARAADLALLEQALARNETARSDPVAFIRSDVDFHLAIAKVTGSEMIVTLYRALDTWLSEQRSESVGPKGSMSAALRCHRQIYEAIRKGDADAAEREMNRHLTQVEEFYWQARTKNESKSKKTAAKVRRHRGG